MSTNEPTKMTPPLTVEEIKRRRQDRLAAAVTPQGCGSGGWREHLASQSSDFPLQPCDLKKWLKYESLPIQRACFVLLGSEPPPLHVLRFVQDNYNPSREPTWDAPPDYHDMLASLRNSIAHGNVSVMKIREGQYETKQATWHDLIRWARSKDYQIAPELETLVAKMEPATVNGTAKVTGDSDLCAVFRELKNLDVSEFSIAFVGDKEESGTGINNMLEISAREVTRRIPLASLELVNRHKASGGLNAVGLILLAMTKNKVIGKTDENEKSVSRFRAIIKKKLGIVGNPFEPYRQGVGWAPLFKLADKRGAADARAKHDAERRTQSLDELKENGIEFSDASSENAVDPADEWMKRSGNSWAGGADAE